MFYRISVIATVLCTIGCVLSVEDVCKPNPCRRGETCVPEPKNCFTTPCTQYRCEPGTKKCGRNEYFNECGGCDQTCEAIRNNDGIACPAVCRSPGECRCNPGYARNDNGRCVSEKRCTKKRNVKTDDCNPNPCTEPCKTKCVPDPKQCITTPCPQYTCESSCHEVPFPSKRCPEPSGFGMCVEGCSSDEDCSNGQMCCSNGCGHTCQDPVLLRG